MSPTTSVAAAAAAALWGQEIKFGIYFDIMFGAFSMSPPMQSVICGLEQLNDDNKLKVPVEKLWC